MLIVVLRINDPDQAHIFQYIYCKNFRIHQQLIMYRFERTNHDTQLGFLFQSFSILFRMLIVSNFNLFHV